MFVSNNICKIIWNAGLKLAVLAMLFLTSSFSLRAQASDVLRVECSGNVFECRFFFPFDSAVFQTSYMDNAKTVAKLDSLLGFYGVSKVENLKVIAYSSPEGVYQYNVNLSARRAESLRNFIASKYPALAGKVALSPGDESWDTLRAMIENDIRLGNESRSKMLEIIDSNDAPDVKERKLSAMSIYKYLYSNYFKKLRYAAIRLTIFSDAMQGFEPKAQQPEFDFIAEDILPKLRRATYSIDCKPAEPFIVPELTFDEEIPDEPLYGNKKIANILPEFDTTTPPMEYRHLPVFAASTNLLFDLAITPNFSLELPIGKEWSIYGDYTFPWWVNKANDRAWQILKWDLGVRHWFSKHNVADPMDILNGHFAALEFSAGYYDIEPKHKGNQGEFQSFSFQYGYAWNLSQFWRLEAFAGIGWLGTRYRHYEGNVGDTKLLYKYSAKTQWFGPTDAGISIKYIFTRVPGRRIAK